MAFEQGFLEPIMHFGSDGDVSIKQKKGTTSVPKRVSEDVTTTYFDCNICLDSAHEPVVSFCGHLYCWPCIYKWLEVQSSSSSSSSESPEQPKCPVCKAYISKSSFVPLYGHDLSSSSDLDTKKLQLDLPIPQRPPALGVNVLLNTPATPNSILSPQLQHNHFYPRPPPPPFYLGSYAQMGPSGFGGTAIAGFFSPTIGMMFGSVDTTLFACPSFNGSSPRMRRQEMQVDKSLNRLYIFLLCCIFLCLLLF